MREGKGTIKYVNGSEFTGEWKNDKKNGFGVLKQKGEMYEGYFYNDMKHGNGTYTDVNGGKFQGRWEQD
jgi:hypothetical protein